MDWRSVKAGGEGEIRTPGALSSTSAFEAGAFNHSATSPIVSMTHRLRRCLLVEGVDDAAGEQVCTGH
jgi:hypothetical protein